VTIRPPADVADDLQRRAAHASVLARISQSGREALEFAAGLHSAQSTVAGAIAARPATGRLEADLPTFAADLEVVVRFAAARGPAGLGEIARARGRDEIASRLLTFWNEGGSGRDDYLSRALLRPYLGVLASRSLPPSRDVPVDPTGGRCPFCGGLPWIAWRAASGSEGAQRYLGCALCGTGWSAGRVRCPACGEESPDQLASYQSDRHPAARIETCVRCHLYIKSIDLTLDARAIPEIDDLLSLAMDLWANDQGYHRLEPGLAGL
jgi:hypothetical protein